MWCVILVLLYDLHFDFLGSFFPPCYYGKVQVATLVLKWHILLTFLNPLFPNIKLFLVSKVKPQCSLFHASSNRETISKMHSLIFYCSNILRTILCISVFVLFTVLRLKKIICCTRIFKLNLLYDFYDNNGAIILFCLILAWLSWKIVLQYNYSELCGNVCRLINNTLDIVLSPALFILMLVFTALDPLYDLIFNSGPRKTFFLNLHILEKRSKLLRSWLVLLSLFYNICIVIQARYSGTELFSISLLCHSNILYLLFLLIFTIVAISPHSVVMGTFIILTLMFGDTFFNNTPNVSIKTNIVWTAFYLLYGLIMAYPTIKSTWDFFEI